MTEIPPEVKQLLDEMRPHLSPRLQNATDEQLALLAHWGEYVAFERAVGFHMLHHYDRRPARQKRQPKGRQEPLPEGGFRWAP